MSKPPSASEAVSPQRDHIGLTFLTFFRSRPTGPARSSRSYSASTSPCRPAAMAAAAASAAAMPEWIALWLPLIRGTLTRPAAQPSRAPPGKATSGIDWKPPSVIARAP